MNIKGKVFIAVSLICMISWIVLFILSCNNVINYLWMFIPLIVEFLEFIWTVVWCLLSANKLCDESRD